MVGIYVIETCHGTAFFTVKMYMSFAIRMVEGIFCYLVVYDDFVYYIRFK